MEIQSIRLVRYDFYRMDQYDIVDGSLSSLFETRTELPDQSVEFEESILEVTAIHFSSLTSEVSQNAIESVQAYLVNDTSNPYFYHLLTSGTLTASEVNEITPGDVTFNRSRRQEWCTWLSELARRYPPSLIQTDLPDPHLILVEPEEEVSSELTADPTTACEVFRANAS